MGNDGNFVLRDGSSSVVWQSFDSPTDTILPGQVLIRTHKLYSNANGTVDYSTGNFMLEMQYDGNLVLSAYHFSDPGYWYTGTLTTNEMSQPPVGDYYYRATINDHGNFQQFAYHKSNSSGWTTVWRAIDDPCMVNALCGVNGMCFSQNNETSTCRCIPGYIPLDPNHVSKGCRPETVVNYCADPSMKNFTIEVIDDADFPFESFADLARVKNVDLEGCKKALMDDCDSLAASLVDSRHIDPSRVEEESEEEDLVLSDWVISCMAAGKLETVVGHDPEVLSDFERFERMALVGLWCIHPDAMFRPSMKKVTQMLEGTLEIGIPPSLSDQMSVSNYTYSWLFRE
ncbi:hypothetical protein OIU76_016516 [Salix suchowensis]|nr:hypothetical protein OIU76_016516 [Salix suchowensis]